MPSRSPHPCGHIGCPNLTQAARCEVHAKAEAQEYEHERGSSTQRGYDYTWQQYVIGYKRLHPYCVRCKANHIITPVQCVDHITPVSGADDPRFYDPTNHQSLCNPCHSIKTQEDNAKGLLTRRSAFRVA